MATKKKTTRRKSSKAPSPAQLRARKAFALAAKARSKAGKKKASKKAAKRRNKTIIRAGRIDHLDVSKVHNPGKTTRRNKAIITKPKKVVVLNPQGDASVAELTKRYWAWIRKAGLAATVEERNRAEREASRLAREIQRKQKKNPAKSTRRKYRNSYLDLVIHGHAKKTPSGWLLGGKTFKQGKGIVPASKRGYYLDRATGTVFSKKARNAEHKDADHPIEVTRHYRSGPPGYMTPWQRAHSQGQQGLFDHGIKAAKKRNPRYFAYGIDANGREYDLAIRVAQNKTQTLAWVKKNYPGYKKYVVELSEKFDFIGPKGGVKIKRPKRVTAKKNPSVKSIRKEFAGTVGKASDVFAPIGTPKNVAKLGKLLLIDTENATIKPTGIVYLCADSKGKLHLCGSKNVPIYSGAAQSFGQVKKLEYETAKPHLYPGQGVISFWHKMGEESGNQPTLYADGKGGLKFRGGSYKITREGIVD